MLLHDFLDNSARRLGDRTAIVHGAQRTSWAQIDERSSRLARALARRGVCRGDRVAILGETSTEVVISIWAALKANAVFLVLSAQAKDDKLAYLLDDSGARALIGPAGTLVERAGAIARARDLEAVIAFGGPAPAGAESWEAVLGAEEPEAPRRLTIDQDLAAIIYTSGSTGEPKGVMLTHANMIAAATSITTILSAHEDDRVLCALPLSFNYGLYQVILAARAGAMVVLEDGFSYVSRVLDTMVRERVTGFPGVPTMFSMLAQLRSIEHDLSSVRYLTNTAAALPEPHVARLLRIFPRAKIYSMFGLTECKRCSCLPPEDIHRKPGSVGLAIPNTELWIEDPAGRRLGPGEVGELVIRGANVMRGYWRKPEATRERLFPGPIPGESVLHTGDLCKLDDEGYLYFVARMDDIIKSRGEKVAPREVEDALYALAGVREAAVIGVPDPILGQAVKAFVVVDTSSRLGPAEIVAHCKGRLEPYMVPKHVELREALPRTDTGKIKKSGLGSQPAAGERQ